MVDKVDRTSSVPLAPPPPALSHVPEVRPAPLWALDLPATPAELHFRRSHFRYPHADPETWTLEIGGEVLQPLRLSLPELRSFWKRTLPVVLECAGHRRSELAPRVPGVRWGIGAVSQARWTGVPLGVLLDQAGILPGAREVVLVGADGGRIDGTPGEVSFARSLPLAKAKHAATLVAWEMNDEPLPLAHGAPLRAIVPDFYAVDSVKWLRRIEVTSEPFRGHFQENEYRYFECEGRSDGALARKLPPHSLITSPGADEKLPGERIDVGGVAWGGQDGIAAVEAHVDRGPWMPAELEPAAGPHAVVRWRAALGARPGCRVISCRARDGAGTIQPERPLWNARGYGNNSVHRVVVRVTS